ncbi:fluoride efflux transporter CrcB [Arthrobacter agilis]|uniref:fluoride efflux transporter CrcB n=1 Tax=Arthrobacter agilis TaxID=37921 RepID=UPI000B361971|nr:fluoride efflux transporter CrcB [Arthrobacter agilis]OUM42945.1 chromosome condensation protein CrcB [Arthrobacter agilis]PPB45891.1 fluoride efflux transporter CrcB [Arthrobacter agilis]TPV25433.1 fluoride efflux transporter CrcB [Arthrobacter agilis]VDR33172.1 camphor resistance protein CrcB [Arthrobacter agilis]
MSIVLVLVLGGAGGLGSVARFVLDGVIRSRVRTSTPVGTITINVTGSLLLGFLTGLVLAAALSPTWTLVVGTGFLGGYTTFSTASHETVRLLRSGSVRAALASGVGTAVAALIAAGVGLWLGLLIA